MFYFIGINVIKYHKEEIVKRAKRINEIAMWDSLTKVGDTVHW